MIKASQCIDQRNSHKSLSTTELVRVTGCPNESDVVDNGTAAESTSLSCAFRTIFSSAIRQVQSKWLRCDLSSSVWLEWSTSRLWGEQTQDFLVSPSADSGVHVQESN